MSNPAVYLLAETNIRGGVVRIEDNLGESIHIHVGDLRISLTVKEFDYFYESVLIAAQSLFEMRGLDWKLIDLTALDWDWLDNFNNLISIQKKYCKVGQLYTINRICNDKRLTKIVPIKESHFVDVLKGNDYGFDEWQEVNLYSQNNRKRLEDVLSIVKEEGYPYNQKLIMTDSNRRIYDGDHRAACLYYLYGPDKEIPILELQFRNSTNNFQKEIEENHKYIARSLFKRRIKKLFLMPKKIVHYIRAFMNNFIKGKQDEKKDSFYTINELILKLDEEKIPYYLISHPLINDNVVVSGTIIIDSESFSKVSELLRNVSKVEKIYKKYNFLYSTPRPIFINIGDCIYAIWDRLCCKSKFENSILPLDKYCNEKGWENVYKDENEYIRTTPNIVLIYLLTNCILEKEHFDETDIKYIEKHIQCLDDKMVKEMLNREFFSYSTEVYSLLKKGCYEELINSYLGNVSY